MTIHIREAKTSDVSEILTIVNHAIVNTTANYDYEPHDLTRELAWFADKQANDFPVFVAVCDGKVCGFGTYGPFRFKHGYRFTVEHSVYVHPDYTGKGIGTKLLAQLIETAKSNALHVMIGGIDAANQQSIAFHKKFGFETCGIVKEAAYKFDRWLDLMFMSLKLN